MNKLILEILPIINTIAKRTARNFDTQNELIQSTILKCYDNESTVFRLVEEKKITAWLTTVIWNEYLLILKHEPKDVNPKDKPDEIFEDLLEQLKIRLTSTERAWIKAYIKEGSYTSISERTGIHRNYIAERIKFIIEKCKTLKHTL